MHFGYEGAARGIYTIYSLTCHQLRTQPLRWRWYLVLGVLSMALDGGTQLTVLRESTPFLRTVTGILFGELSVSLLFPYIEGAMQDPYVQSINQVARLSKGQLTLKGGL
jgi:uncharacterized membrane protein